MKAPLPGIRAQIRLAPADLPERFTPPKHPCQAGVLALLYPKNGDWHLCLIKRTSSHPHDKHAGQIAFPGGAKEDSDPDLQYTALREAFEETGIQPKAVRQLGPLTPLYIPVSNFLVHPFLAWTDRRPDFRAQPSEVAAILEPRIEDLFHSKALQRRPIRLASGRQLDKAPCLIWEEHLIWGATAMMLSELWALIESL